LHTGHCILNKHLHRIKKSETPLCPCCFQTDETIHHFLLTCPAHHNARCTLHRLGGQDSHHVNKLLSKPTLLPLLFQFIARTTHFRNVFGDIPDMPVPKPPKTA
ncbi:hypothetical protein B0H10DRAFT_1793786, partial [Mycena sp. CBHHK59/15]